MSTVSKFTKWSMLGICWVECNRKRQVKPSQIKGETAIEFESWKGLWRGHGGYHLLAGPH